MCLIRNHMHRTVLILALFVAAAGLSACGGSTTNTATTGATTNASLAGSVVDGKVSGATLTLYSDLAMTTQVGTGTTDTAGAFSVTLTVATAPDPVYIKSEGGTDIDTGLAAPTMFFVGNTAGANALSTFNVTPLTKDVFDRVRRGDTLSASQTAALTDYGLGSLTGASGLYGDPSASATLKTAAFKKLTAGTTGGTIAAGNYKMFAIIAGESDVGVTAIANAAAVTAGNNFVNASIAVAANGDITGTDGAGSFFTGKVVGSSMIFNIVDSATPASVTSVTRVVGQVGLNGSVAGNFTDITGLPGAPSMTKGMFVGSLIPTTGINAAGLATFISDFYSPGALTGTPLTGTSTGMLNVVARDVFITSSNVPVVNWGRTAVTAVDAANGTVTMSSMEMKNDQGSSAAAGTTTLNFVSGIYVKAATIPTNLLVFQYSDGATFDLYVVTAVGLRRGIYFAVPKAGLVGAGKVLSAGESYMSKVASVAPNPFSLGGTFDITVANIHPGMPGQTRTAALAQGITPQVAGPMTLPGALTSGTIGNGYMDVPAPNAELMVFQGSMFVMKQDDNNLFDGNFNTGGADTKADHLRLVEFYESGAMQGEEIMGGTIGPITMRDFPSNFVGFVNDQANTATPSFSGTLNFLARTIYASSFASFATAYTSGTLTITAPTTTAGSATLVDSQPGGATNTSTLSVAVPAAGAPGVYHISGALGGGGYVDIVWPIGGTKALYMVSASATGTVQEVGEAYMTE